MADKLFSFIFVCVIFLQSIDSAPSKNDENARRLSNIVLDGKKDCGIVDNQKVIVFFKAPLCHDYLTPFKDEFFIQRDYLPCVGTYDALYNLCEFDLNNLDLTIPQLFNDTKTFCSEASKVYSKVDFKYKGLEVAKWTHALKTTMTNNTVCENMCIIPQKIHPLCVNMVVATNEYLRLKELKTSKITTKFEDEEEDSDMMNPDLNLDTMSKKIALPEGDPNAQEEFVNKLADKVINSNVQPAKPGSSVLPSTQKLTNVPQVVETKKETASNTQETTKNSDIAPKIVKTPDAPPRTESNIEKISRPVSVDDAASKLVETKAPAQTSDIGIDGAKQSEMDVAGPNLGDGSLTPLLEANDPSLPQTETPYERDGSDLNAEGLEDGLKLPMDNKVVQEVLPGEAYIRKDDFDNSEDSFTFSYFATVAILCFVAYFLFHYKNKLFALAIEGRKGRNSRGRGRPSSANYSKLQSNLEEAITSNVTAPSATHVLY